MAQNIISSPTRWPRWGLLVLVTLLALVLTWLAIQPAQANLSDMTFLVNSSLDEADAVPGDGQCASSPSGLCTLRAAVQEANALAGGDTILLPAGIYTLTIAGRDEDTAASGDLDITADLTIQGAGPSSTQVDADSLDRVFQIVGTTYVTMTSLSLVGGDSGPGSSGGGIAIANTSTLTLEDAILEGNTAGSSGGGIYNNGGTLILRRVEVLANNAATAAGIRNAGSLSAFDSTIAGNHATQTAGGLLNTGAMTLDGVTISGNIADTNGGGLYLHSGDPATGLVMILNSTISGNQAKAFMGGGIWIYYQTELWLTNSTIANNSAGQGGGILNYHQQAVIQPAGSSVPLNVIQEGNIHLLNTIVANNNFVNCGRSSQTDPIHSLGHNLDSGASCEFGGAGDMSNTDPRLAPLGENGGSTPTQALYPDSPAIDAGDDGNCPAFDQRGVSRPKGLHCDIGAYEFIPSGEANLSLHKVAGPDPVTVDATLTYTLSVENSGPYTVTTVLVTDTLPAAVTFNTATGSGWICGHTTGVVACSRPSLVVGPAPEIIISVQAPSFVGIITNTAVVTSTVADPNLDNNLASVQTTVTEPGIETADLAIAKLDDPDPVYASALLTYTINASNIGLAAATEITVTDSLPGGIIFQSASGSGWSCGHSSGIVTCSRSTLAVGSAPEIVISVLSPDNPGVITNTVVITSTTDDPNPANNTASIQTTVVELTAETADLSIGLGVDPDPVTVGDTLTYTLVVTNAGPDTATNLSVQDVLPVTVQYLGVSGSGWSCSHLAGTVTCSLAALDATSTTEIIIHGKALSAGNINNSATVNFSGIDPDLTNNSAAIASIISERYWNYLPFIILK